MKKMLQVLWFISLFSLSVCQAKVSTMHPTMVKIHTLIDASKKGLVHDVVFMTAGDSKRDGLQAFDTINYARAFNKFNIRHIHESVSSITTTQWLALPVNKKGFAHLKKNATGKRGSHSIIEFSLGTNDLNRYLTTYFAAHNNKRPSEQKQLAYIKGTMGAGIDAIRREIPNGLIFLAEATGIENPVLKKALSQLSFEKNLPLIKGIMNYTEGKHMQSAFYADNHHPSVFGSLKILRNTLSHLVSKKYNKLTQYDFPMIRPAPSNNIGINLLKAQKVQIENKIRIFDVSQHRKSKNFKSFTLNVIGGTILKVKLPKKVDLGLGISILGKGAKGIVTEMGYVSSSESRAGITKLRDSSGKLIGRYIYVPKEAKKIVFNLSITGQDFKLSEISVTYMSQKEIRQYLPSEAEMMQGISN